MLRVAVLACLAVVALSAPFNGALDNEWSLFKSQYNKNYQYGEEMLRRAVWESNVKYVQSHNLAADRGVHTFWLGMNEYADMPVEEFVQVMNGYRMNITRPECGHYMPPSHVGLSDLPEAVDWRTKGYVTEIKNQGQCGSCWSFSATGSLEGQHFKKTGNLVSLSEKNLMDCSRSYGNNGCKGGLMDQAFEYIIANHGIDTEQSYPYEPRDGTCHFSAANIGATEVSCMDIKSGSESDLQSAVATVGPISVAIDAGHRSFQLYKTGIYTEAACSSTRLDHGVLAVGYGSENGEDYWLVKNSWGVMWGMQGYIKMARNHNNMCGIATVSSFPTV